MYTVLIVGWKEGRDVLPISFAKMVRKHLAMDLRSSKRMLDDFAERGEIVLAFEDKETAHAVAAAAKGSGACSEVVQMD
jgi:hypothetical protein